jgi:hypothetical protein
VGRLTLDGYTHPDTGGATRFERRGPSDPHFLLQLQLVHDAGDWNARNRLGGWVFPAYQSPFRRLRHTDPPACVTFEVALAAEE